MAKGGVTISQHSLLLQLTVNVILILHLHNTSILIFQSHFVCPDDDCNRKFISSLALERHMVRVHDDENYSEVSCKA